MHVTIKEIQADVWRMGEKINAPAPLLIVRDSPSPDGSAYVEISHEGMAFVSSERGMELSRKNADSMDEILYLILSRVAKRMGMKYELNNRVPGQDSRRMYFSKWISLLDQINGEWGDRARKEVDQILTAAPYNDVGSLDIR